MQINIDPAHSSSAPAFFRKVLSASLLALIAVSISACGGSSKKNEVAKTQGPDITRPPQTIEGETRQPVQERSPEETISFDEWRKRRLEELKKQQP